MLGRSQIAHKSYTETVSIDVTSQNVTKRTEVKMDRIPVKNRLNYDQLGHDLPDGYSLNGEEFIRFTCPCSQSFSTLELITTHLQNDHSSPNIETKCSLCTFRAGI